MLHQYITSKEVWSRGARTLMGSADGLSRHNYIHTACGRPGCLAVYMTNGCHFCEAAGKVLRDVAKANGIPEYAIREVTEDTLIQNITFDNINALPAIRVCDTVLTGIIDIERVQSTLEQASKMKCFLRDNT
jgi:hypothetical protein